jgi:hypothetical protein
MWTIRADHGLAAVIGPGAAAAVTGLGRRFGNAFASAGAGAFLIILALPALAFAAVGAALFALALRFAFLGPHPGQPEERRQH